MEITELDGVGCYKLCRNTTPIATTNNGDLIHDDDDVNLLTFKHKLQCGGERERGTNEAVREKEQ